MNSDPDFDFDFGPLDAPQKAELGGVTRKAGRKGDRAETAARRNDVLMYSRAGLSQAQIARKLNTDAATVSNDLAYIAKQALESYENADGTVLMADIMTDYLNIRRSLYAVMGDPACKASDRVAAAKGLMQCVSDFKGFLATAGILSQENTGGGKAEQLVNEIGKRLESNDDNSSFYDLFDQIRQAN